MLFLKRAATGLVAALLLLVVLGIGVLVLYPAFRRTMDDPGHAEKVFGDVLAHERVLASRRWHRFGAEAWDCTYAIVEIPKTAHRTRRPKDTTDARGS